MTCAVQDGCYNRAWCLAEGECHYTGSPLLGRDPSAGPLSWVMSTPRRVAEGPGFLPQPAPGEAVAEDRARRALAAIREVTGATQSRPYTALSVIDGIARRALA